MYISNLLNTISKCMDGNTQSYYLYVWLHIFYLIAWRSFGQFFLLGASEETKRKNCISLFFFLDVPAFVIYHLKTIIGKLEAIGMIFHMDIFVSSVSFHFCQFNRSSSCFCFFFLFLMIIFRHFYHFYHLPKWLRHCFAYSYPTKFIVYIVSVCVYM